MKHLKLITLATALCFGGLLQNSMAANYYRQTIGNGSWHDASTWTTNNINFGVLPGAADGASLYGNINGTIDLFEAAVSVYQVTVGFWNGTNTAVTLNISTNLTVTRTLGAGTGTDASRASNGSINLMNGAIVSARDVTLGSTSFGSGTLTLDGGSFLAATNSAGYLTLKAHSSMSVNDGTVSLANMFSMESGSQLYLSGASEVWITGDQTANSTLTTYISDGWLYGNGAAGNVQTVFDTQNNRTVISAIPEPATIGLFGVSAIGIFLIRRHFSR